MFENQLVPPYNDPEYVWTLIRNLAHVVHALIK